mmetsp:Transcript_7152/g.23717  ORF Transcript_7152/g.23717 Transcript_7152/m.23717 type:complete len:266 (-) Transcript_7152:1219-2016(-)
MINAEANLKGSGTDPKRCAPPPHGGGARGAAAASQRRTRHTEMTSQRWRQTQYTMMAKRTMGEIRKMRVPAELKRSAKSMTRCTREGAVAKSGTSRHPRKRFSRSDSTPSAPSRFMSVPASMSIASDAARARSEGEAATAAAAACAFALPSTMARSARARSRVASASASRRRASSASVFSSAAAASASERALSSSISARKSVRSVASMPWVAEICVWASWRAAAAALASCSNCARSPSASASADSSRASASCACSRSEAINAASS